MVTYCTSTNCSYYFTNGILKHIKSNTFEEKTIYTMNCIIVDDESSARSLLRKIITENCPNITIVDEVGDVASAVKSIHKHAPHLVFLDIEMPNQNGFALFDYFETPTFETIFCTAYSEYALKAFEVSALDYILKPVSVTKIIAAVEKAIKLIGQNQIIQRVNALKDNLQHSNLQKIALPLADGLVFVKLEDVLYFEADGAYTHVVLKNSKTLVSKKLKDFEDLLSGDTRFFRTHRSYIVNVLQIKKYTKKEGALLEFDNATQVAVAREKVKEFDEFIGNLKV
jgi:two-component system, LytTR family, response regulator